MTARSLTLQPIRPLAWIGMETTGTGPATSRIAKIAILRIESGGATTNYVRRLNPGNYPDCSASTLHGTRRRDNAKYPTFGEVQLRIRGLLSGCDLIGYNLKRFTVPFLTAEFERIGARVSFRGCNLIELKLPNCFGAMNSNSSIRLTTVPRNSFSARKQSVH